MWRVAFAAAGCWGEVERRAKALPETVSELDDQSPEADDQSLEYVDEAGWRAFLGSWKWGAILAVAFAFGLIAIFSAHPFASASVSVRVSDKLGQPASCVEVGAVQVADVQSRIYRCTVGLNTHGPAPCFAISGREIKQLSGGNRKLGC